MKKKTDNAVEEFLTPVITNDDARSDDSACVPIKRKEKNTLKIDTKQLRSLCTPRDVD